MRLGSLLRVALAAAVLCYGGVAAASGDDVGTRLSGTTDIAAMVDLETRMADSIRFDQVVPVVYDSADQLPGHVVGAPYWGDTALWSGVYLAGESYRYRVATHYLTHSPPGRGGRAFWTAQRDDALAKVLSVLRGEHRDVTIAEDWQESLRVPPLVNTKDPTGPHAADFGGGLVPGQPGMLMRACTPSDAGSMGIVPPADPTDPVDHSSTIYQITWNHGDHVTYNCETAPTRDTYAGVIFGMLTAFDAVGPDFPEMRSQIRNDLLAMAGFLVKYGWSAPRPTGKVGTTGQDDLFIWPLFASSPLGRLNVVGAARHVAEIGGSSDQRVVWDAAWAEELASQGPLLAAQLETDAATLHDSGYYGLNLDHLNAFDLLRTVTGTEREVIARAFAIQDKTTRHDLNAHFESLTYAVTGDPDRLDDAVTHLGQWLQYRANVAGGQLVRNSSRCGHDLTCVPQDQYALKVDQAPGGSVTWYPGAPEAPPLSHAAPLRASGPLQVAERPPCDFLWQCTPNDLDGHRDATWREPGIDFLTPYWLLRFSTEVDVPARTPLPEWAGPASS